MSGPGDPQGHLGVEQLSGLLDGGGPGGARSGARAHVGGCPRCAARLEALRAAAGAVQAAATTPPAPPGRRDEAVRAALEVLGPPGATAPAGGRPRWVGVLGGLAAAAAAVVAVTVGLSQGGPGPGAHVGATAGPSAPAVAGPARDQGGGAGSGTDLGPLAGPQAVAAAVDAVLARRAPAPPAAPAVGAAPAAPGCPAPAQMFSPPAPTLLLEASATYQAAPAQVFVYATPSGRQAVVVARRGCAVLARVPV